MVVMQFFATDDNAPRYDIGAGIFSRKGAIAPIVPDTVDDAGGKEWDPHHLDCPDRDADWAEQHDINGQHGADAENRMWRVNIPLHPVIRSALPEFLHRFGFFGFCLVQFGTLPQHFVDADDLRAVRVFFGFTARMMLAMNCRPLFGFHAGCYPQPEAEKMAR